MSTHTPTPWDYKETVGPDGEFCFFEIGPRFEDAPEYINVVASTWHKNETINKHDAMLICEAVNNHDRLTAEVARLVAFIADIFKRMDWPDCGDLDGGDLQEIAEKHGLLIPTEIAEPCGEDCACADALGEFPLTCYRYSPELQKALNPEEPK